MTVRVQSLGGASVAGWVEYLSDKLKVEQSRMVEAHRAEREGGPSSELADYYGQSQKSFWHGDGAARLGLSSQPTRAELQAIFEGVDPGTGEQLGRKFGEASVRGFDAAFSVQKEVSVLWAASDWETRLEIEKAVVESAKAVLDDVVGARASTRMRRDENGEQLADDGSPVVVGAEGAAIAIVPEFTSRAGDPHMHVHAVISSKVYEPTTDRWLALDARELKLDQRALSGAFHVGLEAELAARLGVAWGTRKYAYARTIDGIGEPVVEALSERKAQTGEAFAEKLARFEQANDYEPSPQQKYRMEREAQRESRASKEREQLEFDSWKDTIGQAAGMPAEELARSVVGYEYERDGFDVQRVNQALADLVEGQSSFTRGDLFARLSQFQDVGAGVDTAAEAVAALHVQTNRVLDAVGMEVTPAGTDEPVRRYTTEGVLREEVQVLDHIDQATRNYVEPNTAVGGFAPDKLDSLQLAAASRAASTAKFEAIVGLAGTGKTTMLKTAAETLNAEGRESFGLTVSASAADVLQKGAGIPTDNIAMFLTAHAHPNGPSPEFQLPAGTTLFIDEAGMVGTPHWAQLTGLAEVHDWRIVAVGDPYQFTAVGRGGVFEHLMKTLPEHRISRLEQVHRFSKDWEGPASARIRSGDTKALDEYFDHGRIHSVSGNVQHQAITEYVRAREDGADAALFSASNETVAELNQLVQAIRLHGRALDPLGDKVLLDSGPVLYVGDEVETRRNDRRLVTNEGEFVKNRDRWTITGADKYGVTLEGESGSVTVPLEYAKSHVQLAYAQTSHASQGRTVDVAVLVIDPEAAMVDRAGVYVPMTRGRERNEVFIAADSTAAARTVLEEAIGRRWIDTPALSHLSTVTVAEQVTLGKQRLEQSTLFDPEKFYDPPSPVPQPEPKPEWVTLTTSELIDTAIAVLKVPDDTAPHAERLEYSKASVRLDSDRLAHGENATFDPHIQDEIGPPPTGPVALTAWKTAAGALQQTWTINSVLDADPESRTLQRIQTMLSTDAQGAVGELAERLGGPQHVPALRQSPATPDIEPPSPTRGIGL